MPRAVAERPTDLRVEGPGGLGVLVEWFCKGTGIFGVDRRCERAGATHGRLTSFGPGGKVSAQRVLLADGIDSAVDAITNGWATDASPLPVAILPADSVPAAILPADREPVGKPGPARSHCERCDLDRKYEGRQRLVERLGLTLDLAIDTQAFVVELYACPACGSLELFMPGRTAHPLR